ncbi:conserved exported protein of unknown function [Pseudodesulfovibrio profundus]|uniref:Uncharacterized protein n=1 Tax=Pseudodesulfovibrio profundus TaxID=57320 RepID=A0A2C8FBY9_9BACT|nr:hypothetical protein [Pseudodesulfovibrio profundus]SOB59572.1 conserved exported protein of unknown function [Pseudodesulfovibrio profundus]
MTKKSIIITALAAVLTLSLTAMAFAGPGYGRSGCGGPGGNGGSYGGHGTYNHMTGQ